MKCHSNDFLVADFRRAVEIVESDERKKASDPKGESKGEFEMFS